MKYGLIFVVLIFLIQACNPEYRLARKYINRPSMPSVLVVQPSFMYKNNVDLRDTIGLSSLDTLSRDSVIYSRSSYLQWVEDSTFLRIFTNSFMNGLLNYGLKAQLADTNISFPQADWKINFVQLQLEENQQLIPAADYEANFGIANNGNTQNNKYDRFLNSITYNTWLRVHSLGQITDSVTLFYSDAETDHLEQGFTLQSYMGKPILIPKNKLQLSDIYQLAKEEGMVEAEMFFDLILNSYLYYNLSNPDYYYEYVHYDKKSGKLYPANDFKFSIIKN